MRKVLSFVLVLSLVLGSFGMAFAAPLSDVAGEKCEDAVNVLTNLGVVSGYPDGEYKPDNIVTRAEMAVIVVRALGLADYATGTSSFSDMGGHWSNPYVAYAASLGIIAGYPDGTFRPDKTVSYDEAATMLVAALGYTPESLTGTWPANYVVKAKSLGILDGIKAGPAGANRGDIAIMAFQTLGAKIGSTDKDGKWTANDPEDTMLARLGAELYDPDLEDDDVAPGAAFVLTKAIADDAVANVKAYLGAYVTAYANSDNEIIAIKDVKSTFLTGEFDDASFDDGPVLKDGGEFTSDADVDYEVRDLGTVDTEFFLNGCDKDEATVLVDKEDATYKIAAKVSGKKIDAVYSVSVWDTDIRFLYDEDMLEDDNINGNNFTLDDDDEIDLTSFELVGVASLADIDEDNVVYVYVGDVDGKGTKEVTKIEVGTEVVTGEITKVNSGKTKITVGGTAYEMWDGSPFSVGLKDEVELFLDYDGKVFEIDVIDAEADNYAIVLLTEKAGSGAISAKDAKVKLFLADGTTKVFDVDTDVELYDANWDEDEYLSGTLVEYGVDKDGVIDVLERVTLNGDVTSPTEVTAKGYFDRRTIASDVLVFTYDKGDKDDEDSYGVTTLAKITGNKYDDVDYLYDATSKKITLMVINGEGSSDDEIYGLITGWFETTASDTDYMVTVLVDGDEEEYELTSAGKTAITAGGFDEELLYMLEFNSSGQLKGVKEVKGVGDSETDADLLKSGTLNKAYANGVVKIDKDYTIAFDAIAYKWDDDEYVKKTVNKSNLSVGTGVALYDLDEDGVIDIILINPAFEVDVEITGYEDVTEGKLATIDGGTEAEPTYATAAAVVAALPKTLTITGTDVTVAVTWSAPSEPAYDAERAGTYVFTGTIGALPAGFVDVIDPITTVTVDVVVEDAT
jgi:hypothetical protein